MPFAIMKPAVPAITILDISSVPCTQITKTDFMPSPFAKNMYWKEPSIIPLSHKSLVVNMPRVRPVRKVIKATLILLNAMVMNMVKGCWSLYTPKGSPRLMFASVISTYLSPRMLLINSGSLLDAITPISTNATNTTVVNKKMRWYFLNRKGRSYFQKVKMRLYFSFLFW